jgi:chromosome segregation ATPase
LILRQKIASQQEKQRKIIANNQQTMIVFSNFIKKLEKLSDRTFPDFDCISDFIVQDIKRLSSSAKVSAELRKVIEKTNSLDRQNGIIEREIEFIQRQLSDMNAEFAVSFAELKSKTETFNLNNSSYRTQIAVLEQQWQTYKHEISVLEAVSHPYQCRIQEQKRGIESKVSEFRMRDQKHKGKLMKVKQKLLETRDQFHTTQDEIKGLLIAIDKAKQELEIIELKSQEEIAQLRRDAFAVEKQLLACHSELKECVQKEDSIRITQSEMKEKLSAGRQELEILSGTARDLLIKRKQLERMESELAREVGRFQNSQVTGMKSDYEMIMVEHKRLESMMRVEQNTESQLMRENEELRAKISSMETCGCCGKRV